MTFKKNTETLTNIAFWLLLWSLVLSIALQLLPSLKAIKMSVGIVSFLAILAYSNALILLPRFFKKGKFGYYFLAILGLLGFVIFLYLAMTRLFFYDEFQRRIQEQTALLTPEKLGFSKLRIVPLVLLSLVTLFVSTVYQLAKEFLIKEHRNTHLEKEKIKHELNFLRAQINPHFLFNALNNLHATVQLKPEKAGDFILKLSEMLRYVLEDGRRGQVALSEEIQYLENYIFFQKQKDENFKNINFTVTGADLANFYIEPMLLIALVENAFQHSYSEDGEKRQIELSLIVENGALTFSTKNNLSEMVIPKEAQTGLGIQNIQRRLALLYPNQHIFKYEKRGDFYFTKLVIKKDC